MVDEVPIGGSQDERRRLGWADSCLGEDMEAFIVLGTKKSSTKVDGRKVLQRSSPLQILLLLGPGVHPNGHLTTDASTQVLVCLHVPAKGIQARDCS